MNNLFRKSLILVFLLCGLLVLTSCGGSSGSSGDSSDDPTAEEIKQLIESDISIVDEQVDNLDTLSAGQTGVAAATLCNNAYALQNRLATVTNSLDTDVAEGYITEVEKNELAMKIDEVNIKIAEKIDKLKDAAGSDASSIDPSTKIITVTSKKALDYLISDNEELLDNLQRGADTASKDIKVTMENLVSNRLVTVKTAIDQIDRFVSDGYISEDEKSSYLEKLEGLRDGYMNLEEELIK